MSNPDSLGPRPPTDTTQFTIDVAIGFGVATATFVWPDAPAPFVLAVEPHPDGGAGDVLRGAGEVDDRPHATWPEALAGLADEVARTIRILAAPSVVAQVEG